MARTKFFLGGIACSHRKHSCNSSTCHQATQSGDMGSTNVAEAILQTIWKPRLTQVNWENVHKMAESICRLLTEIHQCCANGEHGSKTLYDHKHTHLRTHSPSWLAWSECWRPPGAQSTFIRWTRWTLAMTLVMNHDDSTINIVVVIIIIITCTQEHTMHTLALSTLPSPGLHYNAVYYTTITQTMTVWLTEWLKIISSLPRSVHERCVTKSRFFSIRGVFTARTHTCLTAVCLGLPGWAGTRKEKKPVWILLKQETVCGSDISWAVCKSVPRSRQITR